RDCRPYHWWLRKHPVAPRCRPRPLGPPSPPRILPLLDRGLSRPGKPGPLPVHPTMAQDPI
ncbi:hypothetical protein EV182_005731, partial [Spiromyces aspiralis]